MYELPRFGKAPNRRFRPKMNYLIMSPTGG
jgi:hypothetical protein